ncbi:hypothetical protein [Neptuniibacter sp. QD57_21]|uniref:hypothetical protein n=1 Tax=Neptuniibacter sp. QD57_21 TaxID=3398213 RepID=UPI0039F4D048
MKKSDALYLSLIESISELCEDFGHTEAYWNTLESDEREVFDSLTEALTREKLKLARCKRDRDIYSDYELLLHTLDEFDGSFSNYPGFNISKIRYIVRISEAIFRSSSVIPDEDVALQLYHVEVNHEFDEPAYITEISSLDKAVAWFSPSSDTSVSRLVQYNPSIDLWYSLLQAASEISFHDCGELIFYSKEHHEAGVSSKNISALLKLHMTSSGLSTVPLVEYSRSPSNSSLEYFCPSQSYLQFVDVVGVLGEYNNRKDVLSKYLSIFHIIENFMFKEPIVALERASSGAMFSIRDFKRLYKSVEVDEKKAVNNLFKKGFSLPFENGDFKVFAYQQWQNFMQRNSAIDAEVKSFLRSLSINDIDNTNQGNFFDFISRVVYQVRCSIVHNKETEVHISGENYPIGCKAILEDFLLQFLEELIFLLISKENDLVWYSSDSIKLWRESA